jgi:hypothetical protein
MPRCRYCTSHHEGDALCIITHSIFNTGSDINIYFWLVSTSQNVVLRYTYLGCHKLSCHEDRWTSLYACYLDAAGTSVLLPAVDQDRDGGGLLLLLQQHVLRDNFTPKSCSSTLHNNMSSATASLCMYAAILPCSVFTLNSYFGHITLVTHNMPSYSALENLFSIELWLCNSYSVRTCSPVKLWKKCFILAV